MNVATFALASRRLLVRMLLVLALAASMMLASSGWDTAGAHSKGSNFCGGNHWYGAYRHYIESSGTIGGQGYICWFAKLGGIGGGKYHSTSICA